MLKIKQTTRSILLTPNMRCLGEAVRRVCWGPVLLPCTWRINDSVVGTPGDHKIVCYPGFGESLCLMACQMSLAMTQLHAANVGAHEGVGKMCRNVFSLAAWHRLCLE